METPLLVREEDPTNMIDFWSPTRRPPRAPPPSPRISACHILDEEPSDSSSRHRTLTYLNQQLEFEKPRSTPHHLPIDRLERTSGCFFRTQCSSDDGGRTVADMHHNRLHCEDDSLTLVNPSSSLPSNTSEVNTLSELSRDSDCESLDLWIESSPKYPLSFHKPWMSTLPTHESFPKASRTGRRCNAPMIDTGVHRASCPSHAIPDRTTSPSTRKPTSVGPALDDSFSDSTCERSQSWAGFESHHSRSDSTAPLEPSEKSAWEPDSSDDEAESSKDEQKSSRLHRRVGRSLSHTFRPLFCR